MALIDVRRAYFYVPARRRVFVELPPEFDQPGDEHMCGLLAMQLVRHTRRRPKLGGGAHVDAHDVWRGCIKGEDIVATVHGDDITVGGERLAVELLIKMISRKVRDQEASDRGRPRP